MSAKSFMLFLLALPFSAATTNSSSLCLFAVAFFLQSDTSCKRTYIRACKMLSTPSFLVVIVLLNLAVAVSSAYSYSRADFLPGFIFGAGTTAYQVEGAANEDGRTPSIWDTFAHSGKVYGTGDVACDEYHRYKEDVQLMVETGLDAYRFSISWSRLIPNGRGPVNLKGLQYYNNLINELIHNGIQPHVTLHNYDLPQALEDEYGGWISRKIIKDFTAYAEVCFKEFGDRVSYWTTVNEPNIMAVGGYDSGITPPSRCSSPFGVNCTKGNSSSEPYIAVHHMLLAHASAARLYKKKYQGIQNGYIGLSIFSSGFSPWTNSSEDAVAVQRTLDFMIGWIAHPLAFGEYPPIMKENAGSRLPVFSKRESKLVKGSFDFIGVIYYYVFMVKDRSNALKLENRDFYADMAAEVTLDEAFSHSELPIDPWGLQSVLEYFDQVCGNPTIYIYENGQRTPRNSSLEDMSRVNYLQSYIGGLLDSVKNGSNVRGYFVWSFLDVFELLDGYESRYGLYYVDLDDPELKRYPKLSAHWYSRFLRGNPVSTDGVIRSGNNLSSLLSSS